MFFNQNKRIIGEMISIIMLAFITYWFSPQSNQYFAYYHNSIEQLELWRFLTASFCHTNFNHFAMNAIGLVITVFLFIETYQKNNLWPLIVFNSFFIAIILFFFEPNVSSYVGLSGVLHGVFSFAVINDIVKKDKWGWILGAGLIVKVAYEQYFGASQATIDQIGAPVLINAHFYGVIAGIVFYLLKVTSKRFI